jgi:hypothetical protein
MRRPLAPSTSETTESSFTLASSSTFWMRCLCCTASRTSCLRVRVRSLSSWIGSGGTKLEQINPCASRSAIQVASFTSLLRPGTLRVCAALASTSSNSPSNTCHTGFQYTLVDSIATCVQPASRSQSASATRPRVVVGKLRTSRTTRAPAITRRHATTVCLCTSSTPTS